GQDDVARQLRAAADAIRDGELRETIEWSRNLTQPQAPPELIDEMERRIERGIGDVRDRLDQAREALAVGERAEDAEEAVERAAALARGVESLEALAREASESEAKAGSGAEAGDGSGTGRGAEAETGRGAETEPG